MKAFGGPVFPQGRNGSSAFVRHLKGGGQLVLLFDQHVFNAPVFDFIDRPAGTAISAAELIPFYGIRKPDGLDFETLLEAPIPHSDPLEITQALNDSFPVQVRERSEQWFWVHRPWRPDQI